MKFCIIFFIASGLISDGICKVIKRDVPLQLSENLIESDNAVIPMQTELNKDETTISNNLELESTDLPVLNLEVVKQKKLETNEFDEENNVNNITPTETTEQIELQGNETGDGLRQNAGSTQRPGIIQQLVQNNPISNFIQTFRPRPTSQPQADEPVSSSTIPPNFFQQGIQTIQQNIQTIQQNFQQQVQGLQQQVQGLQQNLQGFINPNAPQFANISAIAPPLNLFNNLFVPQNATNPSPPGPIQNFLGGIFGGNNRNSSSTPAPTTTSSTLADVTPTNTNSDFAAAIIDEVNERPDSNENEHDIYVGDDENLPLTY